MSRENNRRVSLNAQGIECLETQARLGSVLHARLHRSLPIVASKHLTRHLRVTRVDAHFLYDNESPQTTTTTTTSRSMNAALRDEAIAATTSLTPATTIPTIATTIADDVNDDAVHRETL